jgi:hypothetical protein
MLVARAAARDLSYVYSERPALGNIAMPKPFPITR